jgi:hypothetical protein
VTWHLARIVGRTAARATHDGCSARCHGPIPAAIRGRQACTGHAVGHREAVPCRLVTDLQNVWICAQDLQLIRADRVISLLIPVGFSYGAASSDDMDLHGAVCAEIDGGTGSDTITRVKLTDCGNSPAGELLAGLARALGSARDTEPASDDGCMFVFAEQDAAGRSRWITANQLPAAWPQSTSANTAAAALTRSPLA